MSKPLSASVASGEADRLLAEVVAEITDRLQAGRPVDAAEYLTRHPDLADRLRPMLEALDLLAQFSSSAGSDRSSGRPVTGEQLGGTLGDFRIVREVGRGGMGFVYEAEQISLRRRVALKVLPFAATMDPRHLQRFHNEAQAAACLHHTNIVPVFFVGSERGVHFYAMQFIDGQPLSDLIRQMQQAEKKAPTAGDERTVAYQPPPGEAVSTPVPAVSMTPLTGEGRRSRGYYRKVAELGVQAAEALDYAHQLGIVHRDIKPANLLLDGRGNLWVTDFGLAHMQHGEASLTMTGQALGTPRYMSPEQALAKRVPIDHRTDVYSLGVTLYELLTLRPAFTSEDRQELLRQIAFEEPARPCRLERGIPAELDIIVLKAMEKRPQDRYATAQELADDLERWMKHEPIRARRPTLIQRAVKWGRRHKQMVAAGTAVMLMALLLAGFIARNRRERALQREAVKRVVDAALTESANWQAERRLPEALSAARRANEMLVGPEVDDMLRAQVQARMADLELLDRLENIRLEQFTTIRNGSFDSEGAANQLAQTFWDAGLYVEALPVEEAAECIRRSTVAVELAAVLDFWAWLRLLQIRRVDDNSWKTLLRVARAADSDPLRARLREVLERRDWKALGELAASEEVFRLPPITLHVVGSALQITKEARGQVEAMLREAQRQHPNDLWLSYNLCCYYLDVKPFKWEEVVRFTGVMVALRPGSSATHKNHGVALKNTGRIDEAIAEYREAIRIKKDAGGAHFSLGNALSGKGRQDEAIAEYREAIRLDYTLAHNNLGNVLKDKGRLDEAIAEFKEAIRIKKDDWSAHNNLGLALEDKGRLDEAIAEFKEAIRIMKDYLKADTNLGVILGFNKDNVILGINKDSPDEGKYSATHCNLGAALVHKGRLDEAIDMFRQAIRIKKDDFLSHRNLAIALQRTGRLEEAIAEYREAILLNKDFYPVGQVCLGEALRDKGQTKEAFAAFRKAVKGYTAAFAAQPQLADDLKHYHRYNAACAAASAAASQGKDADKLDAKEHARLRQQALDWLRADLKAYRQQLAKDASKASLAIVKLMQHWLQDSNFVGVRGAESLAKLPEAERAAWRKLWADVAELLAKAQGKAPAEKKPDTK